jgi:hypothetical protein
MEDKLQLPLFGSGGSYIDLPVAIKSRKAVINIKNNDDPCLRWSILASRYPGDKDPQNTRTIGTHWISQGSRAQLHSPKSNEWRGRITWQ